MIASRLLLHGQACLRKRMNRTGMGTQKDRTYRYV
jgi:hypothetical protein